MRTTPQLVAALNSYTHLPTAPEVNLREHILVDMFGATNDALQEYEIKKGFRLIDEAFRYTAAVENLSFRMQSSDLSMAQMFQRHDLLNTGIEAKLIYPQGRRTKLSEAVEVITAVVTLSCYIVAVALIALVGKIFWYMAKKMAAVFMAAVNTGKKLKKITDSPKMKVQYTTSKEVVTIPDVAKWDYADKVPTLLGGKTGKVKLEARVLAKALLKEWVIPTMKPYTRVYINNKRLYDQLVDRSRYAAENILKTVDLLIRMTISLSKAAKGDDNGATERVKLMSEIAKLSGITRGNIELFSNAQKENASIKMEKHVDNISEAMTSYDYEPPTELLKAVKGGKDLEGRVKAVEHTLKENSAGISKESNAEITQGLNSVTKSLQDIHTQNTHIVEIFDHNTTFATTYMSYLSAMNSVEW